MTYQARQYVVVINDLAPNTCSGSGPNYTVTYALAIGDVRPGMYVVIDKRGAGDGGGSEILSTYIYKVTGADYGAKQIQMTYVSDSAGDGDDSPCDLPSGTGSSGSPNKATHDVVTYLGSAFEMFME